MSPSVKRGLQVAKDLLRQQLLEMPFGSLTGGARRTDLDEAVRWIARQEAIDARRRGPRWKEKR